VKDYALTKLWTDYGDAHAPFCPKFLTAFCSDGRWTHTDFLKAFLYVCTNFITVVRKPRMDNIIIMENNVDNDDKEIKFMTFGTICHSMNAR